MIPASTIAATRRTGSSTVDRLLSARVDADWIGKKSRIEFSRDVMRKLRKAVYGVGQREGRWFSGGSELSPQEASRLLDYAILVEFLLRGRRDLKAFRNELLDCREQLRMQVDRYTEGQPERVAALIDEYATRLERLLDGPSVPR